MPEITPEQAIKDEFVTRPVCVRALVDCETWTHELKKGQVTEMQSDHAKLLIAEGKVELYQERAVAEPVKEKRG